MSNCYGKTFGEVFGNKLLQMMRESFGETYKKGFPTCFQRDEARKPMWDNDQTLRDAYSLVFKTWYLEAKQNREKDELALLLSEIIKNIYLDKG